MQQNPETAQPKALLDGYVTEPAVLREFDVCEQTLARWAKREGMPRIVIGKQVFYRVDAVREWPQSREK
jgi:hypothetical protein